METGLVHSLVFVLLVSNINYTCSNDEKSVLSRQKRYVVFPEGSSLTIAFCITMNLVEDPTGIFLELFNFGINYDLPNKTGYFAMNLAEPKHLAQRRYRRELYSKMETVLYAMGFDGRTCVYRALCEAGQKLFSTGENLLEELIRRIFKFPLEKIQNNEPEEHRLYHWAHRIGLENQNCDEIFANCGIPIVDVLLGYRPVKYKY